MDIEEDKKADEKDNTVEQETVPGLGLLLKEGREKKGLDYEEMAQITKLRAHALKALENEAWHLLPPPVFVKGFIKSYAKALGLRENKLLDLYQRTIPHDTAPSPQIISPPKRTKKGLIFVLIVLLGLLSVSLYLWMGKPFSEPTIHTTGKEPPSKIQQRIEKKAENALPRDRLEEEPDESATKKDSPMAPATVSSDAIERFVLKARIHAETYVKIYVDDRAPKEYVFKPGSRPQWEAKEGFYIMVGNASGIEFDLNGKVYGNLGKEGDVVRLRLPEDFKRQIFEE